MTTAKSLADLFQIFSKEEGPIKAKNDVTGAVFIVLSEIINEGLEVTPEEIEKRLIIYANDFIEVSKKTKVA